MTARDVWILYHFAKVSCLPLHLLTFGFRPRTSSFDASVVQSSCVGAHGHFGVCVHRWILNLLASPRLVLVVAIFVLVLFRLEWYLSLF